MPLPYTRYVRRIHMHLALFLIPWVLMCAFTIMRQSPFSMRRIIYYPKRGSVVVEKQVANAPSMLTRMHTRHGFVQPYVSMKPWGLGVEITVLAYFAFSEKLALQ